MHSYYTTPPPWVHYPSDEFSFSSEESKFSETHELCVQSDVIAPDTTTTTTSVNETVSFSDTAVGEIGGMSIAPTAQSAADAAATADLVKFLSRPVRIHNFTWLESDAVGTTRTISPWRLYFDDARIKYKLNNFAFMQATLKVKILINASPFYYGCMGTFYQPMPNFTPSTITTPISGTPHFIPLSQRPCVWLNPQHNEGAEMTLPMFWHKNWINVLNGADFTNMGKLDFVNFTTLQSANGVVGTGVSVAIYAWAENVKLSGPTVGLALQSDEMSTQADEYGQGAVSRLSSSIAHTASKLKSVPFIGQFATATEVGASAVSSVAKLFGFTNVPVIDDTRSVRSDPFPKMATTEVGYPIEKLTVDSKNELSISGEAVGLSNEDEMAISYLVQKESYLATANWTTTTPVDQIIFTSDVSPVLFDQDVSTATRLYTTPMAWMSNLFGNWRGDIIFKFKVVASPYHKGRLRISFDPAGYTALNISNDPNSSNVVFTKIIDLADATEVEVRVPFQQAIPFLTCFPLVDSPNGWSTSSTPPFLYGTSTSNGTISVRVHNILTAPEVTSNVSVLVFVRGAENLEFANPRDLNSRLSLWDVQSDDLDLQADVIGGSPSRMDDNQYLTNFGESINSLRTLLRRQTYTYSAFPPDNTTSDFWIWQKGMTRLPLANGYDTSGIHSAVSAVAPPATKKYNFAQFHPMMYVMSAFVAYRGSVNWTFNPTSNIPFGNVKIVRSNTLKYTSASLGSPGFSFPNGTQSANAQGFLNLEPGAAGMAMTNQETQCGLSAQLPNYSAYKFQSTRKSRATLPETTDGSAWDMYILEVSGSGTNSSGIKKAAIHMYCGIGTDFGVHFFLNTPTLHYYPSITPN